MKGQVEGQLTLFPGDSHASLFPLPGSEEAGRMTAGSGRRWSGLSGNSGRLGLLERMLLGSSEWSSPAYYLNWKPVDIGQGHFLYQLALSEPDTDAIGWQSSDAGNGPAMWKTPVAPDAADRKMYVNSRGEPNLSGQVKLWPTPKAAPRGDCPSERNRKSPDLASAVKMYNTPTAQDAKNSTLPPSQAGRDSLVGDVMRGMFATPQARDWRTGQACRWEDRERRSRNLNDQIAMYPTPTAGAGLCGGTGNYQKLKRLEAEGKVTEEERRNMSQGNGGSLNPEWVEWLMGFPAGWTDTGIQSRPYQGYQKGYRTGSKD